jgi:Vault protein inter-alpha-trypsin domain
MKPIFALALFLMAICQGHAQSPQMTVKQADGTLKTLAIEEADIAVRITGDVAETVIELNFRNDGDRVAEGEFVLPLPEGATVSGYALEVVDKMRAAVSVEKQRARTAYETVKNRKIDPGIVEREAGNIYRTQIYPIPAKGTKRLRISYTETLRDSYSLPLDFPDPLAKFSLKVEGANLDITDTAGAVFNEDKDGVFLAKMESFEATGTLKVELNGLDETFIQLDEGKEPAFMISTLPPELAPRARIAPKSIALIWDASGSGLGRDHADELALLDAWFAKLGTVSVKLFTLRNTMQEAGSFDIREGKWETLRTALEGIDYDGATDFTQVLVPAGMADLTLLVSEGAATIGQATPRISGPWFFLHPESAGSGNQLANLAINSGGNEIALSPQAFKSGLAKLTHIAPRLISVTGGGVKSAITGERLTRGSRMHVCGTLWGTDFGVIELNFGYGNEIVEKRRVTDLRVGTSDKIVGRLHAQRVLAEMEGKIPVDRSAIIAHCKREGLVSDFTSLIVLERIEDYAEHGIRPPEEELWEQYDELVRKYAANGPNRWSSASNAWRYKLAWYNKRFPGYEAVVLPRMKQVGIWKHAVESQFKPELRDAEAFGVIAGWHEKGTALMEQIPALRSQAEYDAWRKEIDTLHKQGPELAATPLHAPPAGKELAVSVRGLVTEPGVITSGKPLTLRSAIGEAGDLHAMGSLDNVALYRNAGKVVYNTLSEKFEDVPLFPMDMVVVGAKHFSGYESVDPFAASDHTEDSSPATEPAIREQGDVWISPQATGNDFGTLGSNSARNRQGQTRTIVAANISDEIPDAEIFKKQIAAAADPISAYRKHRGEVLRPQEFYIETARILFSNKQDALAKQVLSNLAETRPGDASAMRSWAFWLAEFGQSEDAERVLEAIPQRSGVDALVAMDLAALRTARGAFQEAYSDWSRTLGEITTEGHFAAIALTEFNSLRAKSGDRGSSDPFPGYKADFAQPLPADIRIVLTCADETANLIVNVKEPGGFDGSAEWQESPSGGRYTIARGVTEYTMRRAVPGTYKITCRADIPTTVRLAIHEDWGRPNQVTRIHTFFLDPRQSHSIDDLDFAFRPQD